MTFLCNPLRHLSWIAILLGLGLFSFSARAHNALYHHIEINLTDPQVVTIFYTIHAPEILLDPATDFADIGDEWLAGLSDEKIRRLIADSETLIKTTFDIRSTRWSIHKPFPLQFESIAEIRAPNRPDGPPSGCLLVTQTFPNPGGELTFRFAASAGKRLLLNINRPGQFPEAKDIGPGESRLIPLQENPRQEKSISAKWLVLFPLAIFSIATVIALFFRLAKQTASKP